jgi:phosphoribosylformylglycinamidine synthase
MPIYRIAVAPKEGEPDVYTIYNLEIKEKCDLGVLSKLFCNSETEKIVKKMPEEKFLEVMYHNGVIDPALESILIACQSLGVFVEAAKISHRYYRNASKKVFINKKLVHMTFTKEPVLTTLKPQGFRKGMQLFDFTKMNDGELMNVSKERDLSLSLKQMRKLAEIQKEMKVSFVTDVFPEVFGAWWSNHCFHGSWKKFGFLKIMKAATEKINNSNVVSAYVDNAGGWKFFDKFVAVFKLETHCSPSQKEPYGGQQTKLGGVLRDIFEFALGALAIGNIEMTTVGEFSGKIFSKIKKHTLPAKIIAKETIRAIADYGNPMGVPMLIARMTSHPKFGGKTFALGGTVGITNEANSKMGSPKPGDYVVLVGGRTGNDGLHGATVSSGAITEKTDSGDACHVQIGNPFPEQKMMRVGMEIRDQKCARARTDCGAAGLVSAVGELGERSGKNGGVLLNLALVPLKCAGLENWQIALSESQERFAHVIKPEKLKTAMRIYKKYQLEATVVGVFNDSGNFQIIFDKNLKKFDTDTKLSGEIALDLPYKYLQDCPLPDIEIVEPPKKNSRVRFPRINENNVQEMAEKVVGHFDVCDQSWAIRQYDSTVQGKTFQCPLYGKNYDVTSHLAVLKPVYGKKYGLTISQSFDPWQFEVDPTKAAINAMMDSIVTQVIAGVKLRDICLADNFCTPNMDPYAYWHLNNQVRAIADLSVELGTPFITGKDTSSASAKFGKFIINAIPSVAITAMGKIRNAENLKLHQWHKPGNLLFAIGPMANNLSGSILASALGIKGNAINSIAIDRARSYMDKLEKLAASGIIQSAVPINRGGIILRLFEGVEASGFGIETYFCEELFPENFGSVLIEVGHKNYGLFNNFGLENILVGEITNNSEIIVKFKKLNFQRLRKIWSTKFLKEVA